MFVAAIVIPILFIYFYFITKRERKEHENRWLSIGDIPAEATITGVVQRVLAEKQRYYQSKYIFVQDMTIKSDGLLIKAIKKDPIVETFNPVNISKGDILTITGRWNNDHFLVKSIHQSKKDHITT